MYNIHNGAIRWQIPDFLFYDTSNVCSISHHFRNICKNDKSFDLENEGQSQEVEERMDLRLSTGYVKK